ncbi:hypothetical protein [Paraburkholderia aspalathi]|uniref:hypothetical protein n=1 Tax=Paraburkholderia aspalathi TaxID=1324617 RepID=UPI001F3D1A3D|nr:hypothetical protein [Paraburkholderia aspalathi]
MDEREPYHPVDQTYVGGLKLESLLELVVLLGGYACSGTARPTKIAGLQDVALATRIVEAAADALIDWPIGYHAFLRQMESEGVSRGNGDRLTKRFGYFYTALYKGYSAPAFDFLRSGFESFVQREWSGQLARRNHRLSDSTLEGHGWLPLTVAAKQLKMKRASVCSFITRGLLVGHLHTTRSGRITGTVDRTSLERFCLETSTWLTLTEARKRLQISRGRASDLMAAGTLQPVSGPTVDGRAIWKFSSAHVHPGRSVETPPLMVAQIPPPCEAGLRVI